MDAPLIFLNEKQRQSREGAKELGMGNEEAGRNEAELGTARAKSSAEL